MNKESNVKFGSWMGDTGAIGHMTWDKSELTDLVEVQVPICVANGNQEMCQKKGRYEEVTK